MRKASVLLASLLAVSAFAKGFDAALATNQVGLDVFRQVGGARPGGNLILSPYSIEDALALAYAGSDGMTRTQMAQALHFRPDNLEVALGFQGLQWQFERMAAQSQKASAEKRERGGRVDTIQWSVANRLYGQTGFDFRPDFLALLRDHFEAPFEPLDFQHASAAARETINSWVAGQTHDKIRDLIPPNGITPDTRLALVNALYLKAPWRSPFPKTSTQPRAFHLPDGSAPEVATMQEQEWLGYAREAHATIVTLPYVGNDLQFVIVLPDEGIDPAQLARQLTADDLARWAKLDGREIELYLPKFRADPGTLRLVDALRALGVRSAFDDPRGSANFDRIAPRRPDRYLALDDVFHRAYVAIDEEGTEAAAATTVTVVELAMAATPPKPLVVRVDRPFLFLIQHRPTATCLFLGRITDPR